MHFEQFNWYSPIVQKSGSKISPSGYKKKRDRIIEFSPNILYPPLIYNFFHCIFLHYIALEPRLSRSTEEQKESART